MIVLINPGTGPVDGALLRRAWKNVRALRREADVMGHAIERDPDGDGDGRYGFTVGGVSVLMPGVSLDALTSDHGLPPRLYVDGDSWMWSYAVDVLREIVRLVDRGRP